MSSDRITGRVKWFNSKSGFGFITVCEGSHKSKDIFAHFSSLRGESSQYKYLVQGEYVEFALGKSESEQHEYVALDVSGVKDGLLMCDTHRLNAGSSPRPASAQQAPGRSGPSSDVRRRPARPVASSSR
jgi:CspA family cold shock protein